jgi:hypothetical protein
VASACVVVLFAPVRPGTVAAQSGRDRPTQGESRLRQWELRGVAIAGGTRLAVLVHPSSGQEHVLRVGDGLEDGLTVTTIAEDRVVLDSAGTAVTLRLGHGARGQVTRPPSPARSRWPGRIIGR